MSKNKNVIEKILMDFEDPTSIYRGVPFWAWNGKLESAELRRQVRLMKGMGLGGFFMHSRVGLETPYLSREWFDCVRSCCEEADKLKMQAWLYDEDRWPSGAAGGIVTKHPGYRKRSLVMMRVDCPEEFLWPQNTLAVFTARVEGVSATDVRRLPDWKKQRRLAAGESLLVFYIRIDENNPWHNGYTYLNTLDHKAVREFIRVTYDAYRKHAGRWFGSVIPGVFTDEPNHGVRMSGQWEKERVCWTPWTQKLPDIFRRRYGYDILEHLPEIFLDVDGQPFTRARYHYHECVTFLFVDAFGRQIGDWCMRRKLLFTGHVLCEDTLSSQVSVVGDCMRFYEYMQAPGMDLLTEYSRLFVTAKQVSSVARQFGRKWRLTESYGCTGWDFSFTGHKALGDWQVALGINLRCQHLAWYTMLGEAKRDYPAGIFYQSPWWRFYSKVEDYFARIHAVMTRGREVRDLLVIHPVESMWLKFRAGREQNMEIQEYDRLFWKLSDTLLAGHVDFDYGSEEILARHGRTGRKNGIPVVMVGQADYKTILVPPLTTMRSATLQLLKCFREMGGRIVFTGAPPVFIDAQPSDEVVKLSVLCDRSPSFGQSLIDTVEKDCRRISISGPDGRELAPVLYLLREDEEAFYLFLCNTGQDFAVSDRDIFGEIGVRERGTSLPEVIVRGIPGWSYAPVELDAETGRISIADTERNGEGYEIHTSLPALGSRLFLIPKVSLVLPVESRPKLVEKYRSALPGKTCEVRLSEENVLVLDRLRVKIGSGDWQPENEVLRVDNAIRDVLGVAHRGGSMVQPWVRKKKAKKKTVPVMLSYTFEALTMPAGSLSLAIEQPQRYRIKFNGCSVSTDVESGWWVDVSLHTLPLDAALVRPGRNEIVLECLYDENHPGLEIMYLLGNFGVEVQGTRVVLTAPVTNLAIGDWTKQGLPFYSGSVMYLYAIQPNVKEEERLFIRIPDYRGVALRILVDGRECGVLGWEPYELDITEVVAGCPKAVLGVEVIGHRRNSHGPFHLTEEHPVWTGPGEYEFIKERWQDEYRLVSCGLMVAPELVVRGRP